MRTIKYRVLNKKTNEITDQIVNINLQHNEVCTWKETYGVDDSYIEYEVLFGSKDEFELMQFTGFHDLNEKEIAEGDIIHALKEGWDCFPTLEVTGKIIYMKELCAYAIQHNDDENDHTLLYKFESDDLEIIGNIHENGDLPLNYFRKKENNL